MRPEDVGGQDVGGRVGSVVAKCQTPWLDVKQLRAVKTKRGAKRLKNV